MKRWLGILLTLLACACCATTSSNPYQARPLKPTGYKEVFTDAARCYGKPIRDGGDFADIRWYIVPAGAMGDAVGMWVWPNQIYLDSRYVSSYYVVRHEILHHIVYAIFMIDPHKHPDFARCVDAPQPLG
jgi:hypothetical protein